MKKTLLVFLTLILVLFCTSVVAFAEETVGKTVLDLNQKLNEFYEVEGLEVSSISIVADKECYMVIYGNIDSSPWSSKFALTEEEYLALFHANESVLVYEKGVSAEMESETVETIFAVIDASVTNLDVDINFQPSEFTRNIKYMGLGMLGIFVVVGVVIVLTFVLNTATTKKA